ncbi:hypothetical protein [Lysobacter gummosus]|uniref:hypothetical protein n=1 Tax=Lysobacter gummosus TaxID=262324 RepID=UPI0036411608
MKTTRLGDATSAQAWNGPRSLSDSKTLRLRNRSKARHAWWLRPWNPTPMRTSVRELGRAQPRSIRKPSSWVHWSLVCCLAACPKPVACIRSIRWHSQARWRCSAALARTNARRSRSCWHRNPLPFRISSAVAA